MSLRTMLREIKKEESGKFQGAFSRPPIPFISEVSHIKKCDKKDIVLLANQNATDKQDKKSIIKKNFPVLLYYWLVLWKTT